MAGSSALADDCRRLAYNSWELDTLDSNDYGQRADQLLAAAAHCPANQALEHASLTIYAAYYAANADSAALDAPNALPSARLVALTDQVSAVLAQRSLAVASADALQILDDNFFKAVLARGPKFAPALRDSYVGVMDAAASDARYVEADQLGFIDAKLRALKALDGPKAKPPADVVASANQRIDSALDAEQDPYVRSGLGQCRVEYPGGHRRAAEGLPDRQGRDWRARTRRITTRLTWPRSRKRWGRRMKRVSLLDQAYRESQGAATRFQWGQLYVSGLLRMTPKDSARIQQAGAAVLDELDGPDRIYRRARVRLERLDHELRAWNDASKGQYGDVLQTLHARMQQICTKIPDSEPARASCDAFLKAA
jgi:hypothetical protein